MTEASQCEAMRVHDTHTRLRTHIRICVREHYITIGYHAPPNW